MPYRFENLEVWKLARTFVSNIYTVTKNFPKDESMEEVVAGMFVALDQKYIDQQTLDGVYNSSHALGQKMNALISYLKNHSN